MKMPRPSTSLLARAALPLLAFALSACGGEDKGRPSADIVRVPPPDYCALASGYTYQRIVDFEPEGRSRWATCDPDVSCQSDAKPTPFYFNFDQAHTAPLPASVNATCPTGAPFMSSVLQRDVEDEEIPGGARCGSSSNALHLAIQNVGLCTGENGRLGWGAALDLNFSPAFDASHWDGLALWVRKGGGPTGGAFTLSIIDQQNDAIEGNFMSDERPGCGCRQVDPKGNPRAWTCSKDPGPEFADSTKCDAFGAAVSPSDDWSLVTLAFDRIQQKGFGAVSKPFDPSLIKRLQFLVTFGSWDFWIDDVAFYRAAQ